MADSRDLLRAFYPGDRDAILAQRDAALTEFEQRCEEVCFILWKWSNGWRPTSGYDSAKVNAVARMITANFYLPHRIVCVTDDVKGLDPAVVQAIPMWPRPVLNGVDWTKRPNCFHRLRVFDTNYMAELLGPSMYYWSMDIDVVIRRDFTELMPMGNFTAVEGKHAKYNGSMWAVRPYTNQHVWADFHPTDSPKAISEYIHKGRPITGSDQAWMSMQIPDGKLWPVSEHGPVAQYIDHIHGAEVDDGVSIVFFAGSAKPWNATVAVKCPQLHKTFMEYM